MLGNSHTALRAVFATTHTEVAQWLQPDVLIVPSVRGAYDGADATDSIADAVTVAASQPYPYKASVRTTPPTRIAPSNPDDDKHGAPGPGPMGMFRNANAGTRPRLAMDVHLDTDIVGSHEGGITAGTGPWHVRGTYAWHTEKPLAYVCLRQSQSPT